MKTGVLTGINRSAWVLLVFGVIAVLFALSAFAWPARTAVSLAWAFGVMALAEGVISVIALFRKDTPIPKGWLALYALTSILFGGLAILNPVATAGVLLMFLAVWLIIAGIFRIVFAIRVRKEIDNEWMLAFSGVIAIVLGIVFIAYPGAGLVLVTIWIGLAALIYGALQIVAGWRLRRFTKRF
ncbi:HdeD family acid-resistance protein [Lysobacter niastensis]|uniref:HdeD family acid-resistance protein n=1 Tax=Lysobacter niastensis TaxID=380629 RepID=A0ABS0B5H7_9GAMM|nr:HdeD family acid-resistance protein [Lysobacter niastensis]MBF6023313.1 HdeD family acid-resistance protein [Lysobacter niastensis]